MEMSICKKTNDHFNKFKLFKLLFMQFDICSNFKLLNALLIISLSITFSPFIILLNLSFFIYLLAIENTSSIPLYLGSPGGTQLYMKPNSFIRSNISLFLWIIWLSITIVMSSEKYFYLNSYRNILNLALSTDLGNYIIISSPYSLEMATKTAIGFVGVLLMSIIILFFNFDHSCVGNVDLVTIISSSITIRLC